MTKVSVVLPPDHSRDPPWPRLEIHGLRQLAPWLVIVLTGVSAMPTSVLSLSKDACFDKLSTPAAPGRFTLTRLEHISQFNNFWIRLNAMV